MNMMSRISALRPVAGFLGLLVLSVAAVMLTDCGGGNSGPAGPGPVLVTSPSPTNAYGIVTFTFTIPPPSTSSTQRGPRVISSATLSVKVSLLKVNGATPNPQPTPLVINVTPTTAGCTTNAGVTTCTESTQMPVGGDQIEFQAFDQMNAAGHVLSQQIQTIPIVEGQNNGPFPITMDANAASITANPDCAATGSLGAGFTLYGNVSTNFTVTALDGASQTIQPAAPGAPTLSADTGNHALATASIVGGKVVVTGVFGQTGSTTLTVTETPASPSDGLSAFQQTANITLQAQPQLIAAGGNDNTNACNAGANKPCVLLYTFDGTNFHRFGQAITGTSFGMHTVPGSGESLAQMGFDRLRQLYIPDETNGGVLEVPFCQYAPASPVATGTFVSNLIRAQMADFNVAPDGTMAFANTNPPNQFVGFNPATTNAALGLTPAPPPGDNGVGPANWFGSSVAVLTSNSLVSSGYVVGLISDQVHPSPLTGKFSLVSAGGASCSPGSCTVTDFTNGVNSTADFLLAWDPSNQALYLANVDADNVLRYQYNGGNNGASFSAPTTLVTAAAFGANGPANYLAISHDGFVAVGYGPLNGQPSIVNIYNSAGTIQANWNPHGNFNYATAALDFLPNDSVLIAESHYSAGTTLHAYSLASGAELGNVNVGFQLSSGAASSSTHRHLLNAAARRKIEALRRALSWPGTR
jgi:hypothetical protein